MAAYSNKTFDVYLTGSPLLCPSQYDSDQTNTRKIADAHAVRMPVCQP